MISALRKGVENENFVDNNFSCCVFTVHCGDNNSSCCVFTVERSSSDCQRDATANFAWFRVSSNTPVYYFLLQLLHLLRTLLGIGSTNNFFEEQIVFRFCTTKADFEFRLNTTEVRTINMSERTTAGSQGKQSQVNNSQTRT